MRYFITIILFLVALSAYAKPMEFQDVRVKPGDTLWSISNKYLKDSKQWPRILKYNKLPSSNPSIALPGMILRVPVNLMKEEYRAAKLVYFINSVLYRSRAKTDWQKVGKNMDLYKGDTVRTTVSAKADIKFYTNEILNLYPNSIAVLRPPQKKNMDVYLLAGEMRGLRAKVVTATAEIIPKTKNTEFGTKIKDDLTTLVQVYKGKAEVKAQGKTVLVHEGFASQVRLDMPPSSPVKLPPLPEFDADKSQLAKLKNTPRIKISGGKLSLSMGKTKKQTVKPFAAGDGKVDIKYANINDSAFDKIMSIPNPVQGYRVQVSKDRDFLKIVHDEQYDVFENVDFGEFLAKGIYWVRISYVDLLGFEGKFNKPRRIAVK